MSKGRSGIQMVGRVSSLLQIHLGQQVVLLSTVIPHFVALDFKRKTEKKKIGNTYEYT